MLEAGPPASDFIKVVEVVEGVVATGRVVVARPVAEVEVVKSPADVGVVESFAGVEVVDESDVSPVVVDGCPGAVMSLGPSEVEVVGSVPVVGASVGMGVDVAVVEVVVVVELVVVVVGDGR